MTRSAPCRRRCRPSLSLILGLAAAVLFPACGSDFLWVETINPLPTTTTSTSTTTTTAPPTTTTTRKPAPTTSSTATTSPKPTPAAPASVALGPGPEPQEAAPPPPSPPAATTFSAPLTGLPMDAARAKRPVVVVKIDNAPLARPQVGLNQSDVVFEEGVEGGITRFAALFHSQGSGLVGPVRSARSTDIKIVSAFHRPLFSYSGANEVFKQYVAEAPLVDVGFDAHPDRYHRENGRPSPNNLFSGTDKLFELTPSGAVPPPSLFTYRAPGEAAAGPDARPVPHVRAFWQGASKSTEALWDWDATAQGWRRTQNGEAHVDASGRQVSPPNVVLQFVNYHDTGLVDSSGTAVPEAEVVGEGDAWVMTGGLLIPCRWSKPSNDEVTRYLDSSGAEVRLAPGSTWVELVPPGQGTL